jgi:hypothetical protein
MPKEPELRTVLPYVIAVVLALVVANVYLHVLQ